MRPVIILILFIAVSGIAAPRIVPAADWSYVESDQAGKWYYDRESMTQGAKSIIMLWTKLVYTEISKTEYVKYLKEESLYYKGYDRLAYKMNYWACDCFSRECGNQSFIVYNDANQVIDEGSSPVTEEWIKVTPKSPLDKILSKNCKSQGP